MFSELKFKWNQRQVLKGSSALACLNFAINNRGKADIDALSERILDLGSAQDCFKFLKYGFEPKNANDFYSKIIYSQDKLLYVKLAIYFKEKRLIEYSQTMQRLIQLNSANTKNIADAYLLLAQNREVFNDLLPFSEVQAKFLESVSFSKNWMYLIHTFAKLDGVDVKALQRKYEDLDDPCSVSQHYMDFIHIQGADVNAIENKILRVGSGGACLKFASYIATANISALTDRLCEVGTCLELYLFGQNIRNADLDKIHKALTLKSNAVGNYYYLDLFVSHVLEKVV